MTAPLQAARRDASVYNTPGFASRYHVIVDGLPACNRSNTWRSGAMPLLDDMAVPAHSVAEALRCRRPACRALFSASTSGGVTP